MLQTWAANHKPIIRRPYLATKYSLVYVSSHFMPRWAVKQLLAHAAFGLGNSLSHDINIDNRRKHVAIITELLSYVYRTYQCKQRECRMAAVQRLQFTPIVSKRYKVNYIYRSFIWDLLYIIISLMMHIFNSTRVSNI